MSKQLKDESEQLPQPSKNNTPHICEELNFTVYIALLQPDWEVIQHLNPTD